MDTIYIGDIPEEYCYAVFNNGYVDLYNTNNFISGRTYPFYRVYLTYDEFLYSRGNTNISNYNNLYTTKISVSNDMIYRRDFDKICSTTFIICFGIVLVFNIVTSVFKKGGLLGGLL